MVASSWLRSCLEISMCGTISCPSLCHCCYGAVIACPCPTYIDGLFTNAASQEILSQVGCRGIMSKGCWDPAGISHEELVPYLAAICFMPSYSALEMERTGFKRASSVFLRTDQIKSIIVALTKPKRCELTKLALDQTDRQLRERNLGWKDQQRKVTIVGGGYQVRLGLQQKPSSLTYRPGVST